MVVNRLQSTFNIRPGEERLAALVFGYAILLFSANVLAVTASLGLFFETYDAATLPYTYVLLMFIGPLVSFLYLRFNSQLTLSQALLAVHALLLITLVLLPLLLRRPDAPVVRFILPTYVEINITLTYASFWNLLGRIYNLRQGKRLFPLLSSGEQVATIATGFLATFVITRWNAVALFWLGALAMAAASLLLLVIGRANADKMGREGDEETQESRPSDLKVLASEPYVRLLLFVVLVYTIGIVMVENLAYAEAEIRFPTADGMATYVALFMGIYGVLGLLLQWLIAGRLLDRFGVATTFLSLPGGLFLFMAAFALVGSFNAAAPALFWLSTGANMFAYMMDAPYIAARNVFIQPLPPHLRTQAQTVAMGIAYPLATGLSGLLLLFLLNVLGFDSVQLSYAVLVVLALWLATGTRLGRAYVRRLRQALQARSFGGPGLFHAPDRSRLAVLEEALEDSRPAVVLYALDTLVQVAPEALPQRLPDLLTYPVDEVRLAALRQMAALAWPETPSGIGTLLVESPNPAVRAAALRTWNAVAPQQAGMYLAAYSRDPQPVVRQAALALMCSHDDAALCRQARSLLEELARSAVRNDRLAAAGVLGEIGAAGDGGALLLILLADSDPLVQQAALAAAARVCQPPTWPVVIPYLADRHTASLAVEALAAAGGAVLPLLQAASEEPGQDPQIVAGIAQVCGRLGGEEAIALLEPLLDHPQAAVRRQALLGLSRCAYEAQPSQRASMEARLVEQAQRLAEIIAAQVDIGDEPQVALAAAALEQQRQTETDNLLLLLSFLAERQTVLSAREALQPGQPDDDKRAYAIETLDILLDHADKRLLFPFLRQLEPEVRLAAVPQQLSPPLLGREQRLVRLLAADALESERWPRLCALHALGALDGAAVAPAIVDTAQRFVADPVLLETALSSLAQHGVSLADIAAAHPALAHPVARYRARAPGAMTLLQKAQSLQQVTLFAALPGGALETLAAAARVVPLEPGETIFHKGDPGDSLYVVLEGRVRVHDGQRTIDELGPEGVVGEMALLDDQPRSASVTGSGGSSRLLQLDQESFSNALAAFPQVARELLMLLSRRLRQRTADLAPGAPGKIEPAARPVVGGHRGSKRGSVFEKELPDLGRLFVLQGTEIFGGLTRDLLEQVAMLLEEVDLPGGETLFQAGDPGHSLYIVAQGQVRVTIAARTLAYLGEGEVLGEMALLESEPRSASVVTTVPTRLLRLDQQPFYELLETEPQLAREMIKLLSGRLRQRLRELAQEPY